MIQYIGEKNPLDFKVFCNEIGCHQKFPLLWIVVLFKLELSIPVLDKLDYLGLELHSSSGKMFLQFCLFFSTSVLSFSFLLIFSLPSMCPCYFSFAIVFPKYWKKEHPLENGTVCFVFCFFIFDK